MANVEVKPSNDSLYARPSLARPPVCLLSLKVPTTAIRDIRVALH